MKGGERVQDAVGEILNCRVEGSFASLYSETLSITFCRFIFLL